MEIHDIDRDTPPTWRMEYDWVESLKVNSAGAVALVSGAAFSSTISRRREGSGDGALRGSASLLD